MTALAEESFAPLGLSPSYAFVLMVVHEEQSISTSQVAERVGLNPSTITRLADKLILRGYLERKQEGRNIFLRSTPKLHEEIETINACWEKLYHAYNDVLGKEQSEALNNMIDSANQKF